MNAESGPVWVGICQSCHTAARRAPSCRVSSTSSEPATTATPFARAWSASAAIECGPLDVSVASPPPTITRSPAGASRSWVSSRASAPSTASAPIAVNSFSFDAGASCTSGACDSVSPSPSTQIDTVTAWGATPGSATNAASAPERSAGAGTAGWASDGSAKHSGTVMPGIASDGTGVQGAARSRVARSAPATRGCSAVRRGGDDRDEEPAQREREHDTERDQPASGALGFA